jgi:hypothetical protein
VKKEPIRDASVSRLLGHVLAHDADRGRTEECLDAETMAALIDNGLMAAERAAAEAHAASCSRCQAVLAALVRTEPEPVSSPVWWRLPLMKWLVPVAATGVAAALWVAVDRRSAPAKPEATVAIRTVTPDARAPEPPAPSSDADQSRSTPKPAGRAPAPALARRKPQQESKTQAAAESAGRERGAPISGPLAGAAVPAPPVAPAEPTAAPTPSPQAAEPERLLEAPRSAAVSARASVVADRAERRAGYAGQKEVSSPNPRVRWRIGPGAFVQRTTDDGATWTHQPVGSTTALVAGSSPSTEVCWIVGPAGTVWLTVDGTTWRRVTFPEHVDLISVIARSADVASVVTSDRRVFVTNDRGITWTRQ